MIFFFVQVTIELIKIIKGSPFDDYRNCFLNLALPVFVFSQPAPATRTVIRYVVPWEVDRI
jgi:ubiquitin-activating enzyme E1-like protein 2